MTLMPTSLKSNAFDVRAARDARSTQSRGAFVLIFCALSALTARNGARPHMARQGAGAVSAPGRAAEPRCAAAVTRGGAGCDEGYNMLQH